MSPHRSFFGSIGWVALSVLIAQVFRFVQAIIIARWLGPEEIGFYAYVYAILNAVSILEKVGAADVFILKSPSAYRQEVSWLSVAWSVKVVLSLLTVLILFFASYFLGPLLLDERIVGLLVLISVIPFINAIRSPKIMQFRKHQRFAEISRYEIVASILRTVIPIVLVYQYRSVEWLIGGNLIAGVLITIVSYFWFPIRVRLSFRRKAMREMYFYGKNNLAISFLTVANTTLDDIVVGAYFGIGILGRYSMGYRLGMTPHTFIQSISYQVLLPKYRQARDLGMNELSLLWGAVTNFIPWLYLLILGPFIIFSDDGIAFIFGESWEGMSDILKIVCIIAFVRGLALSISPLLSVMGYPNIDARFKLYEIIIFICWIIAGLIVHSIDILLWGGVFSYFVAFILRLYWWHNQKSQIKLVNFSGIIWGLIIISILYLIEENYLLGIGILILAIIPFGISAKKLYATVSEC